MTDTPTKGAPLADRMIHAFGRERVQQEIASIMRRRDHDILWHLTDEARDLLLYRLVCDHKIKRKFAAASRLRHQEQQSSQPTLKVVQS